MILQLCRQVATTKLEKFDFDALMENLANDEYTGVLYQLRRQTADLLKVPLADTGRIGETELGDLFMLGDDQVLYLKCHQTRKEQAGGEDPFDDPGKIQMEPFVDLEAGLIGQVGMVDPASFEKFRDVLNTVFEVHFNTKALEWSDPGAATELLDELEGEAVATPTPADIELAQILAEPQLAPLFAALRAENYQLIFDKWLEERDDADKVEYFVDKLFEADMFEEEVVVYSRHTNMPVIRAKDRAGLEALQAAGIRDVNGDQLDIENARRLLVLPESKRAIIEPGWAMRVTLIDLLVKLGLSADSMKKLSVAEPLFAMAVLYDGCPLVFLHGPNGVDPNHFADLAPTIKTLDKPIVITIAPGEVDTDAAEAAGAESCLPIAGPSEFNTRLLDYLAKRRLDTIQGTLSVFDDLLSFKIGKLTMARFGDE